MAREFNNCSRPDLFAATPPLEALELVLTADGAGVKAMVNDVGRAHLCAPARGQVFVELRPEDPDCGTSVGELNSSMYGTRDAAQNGERSAPKP